MEQVDPLYLTTPLYQLINEFGYEWLREQDRIFKKIASQDAIKIAPKTKKRRIVK